MAKNYWFEYDAPVVAADDDSISLTFKLAGVPVDVSAWTDMTYKAESNTSTDTITVAHAAMSRTSSGAGVTDTVIIPRSTTDTDITPGRYSHAFSVKIAGQVRSIFRGTIIIAEEIAEVP